MTAVFAGQGGIPVDIIHAILEQLVSRRDLHAATLVSWDFNAAATPLLYRRLDSDTRSRKNTKEVRAKTYSYTNVLSNSYVCSDPSRDYTPEPA